MKSVFNKMFLFYEIVCVSGGEKTPFLSCVCVCGPNWGQGKGIIIAYHLLSYKI